MKKRMTVLFLRRRPKLLAAGLCLTLLILAGSLSQREPARSVLAPALFGVSIVIDAGHGGADPGMVGSFILEKDINLSMARILAEYCRSAGAAVTLTREGDAALAEAKRQDMEERVGLTQAAEADIFISLHCNSFVSDPAQQGAQVFYAAGNGEGERLAKVLQQSLAERLGNTDRSALPHADSYLLKNIDTAAVIVEMGFLSNAREEELLASAAYQWELGWALFRGLADYLTAEARPAE